MSKQIAIKEVMNFNVFDYTTKASVFYADYGASTSIDISAERLDLRGGQGNFKLVSWDHTKSATLKTELPLIDMNFIALLTGKALSIASANVPKREILVSATAGTPTITLSATPVAGTLKIYTLSGARDNGTEVVAGTPLSNENKYSISGAIVSLNNTSHPAGTSLIVTYDYAAPATTSTMTFTADKFSSYYRITGDGFGTDPVTGATVPLKFDILKCKPKNNINLSMTPTEASKLSIDWDIYSDDVSDGAGGIDKVYFKMHQMI